MKRMLINGAKSLKTHLFGILITMFLQAVFSFLITNYMMILTSLTTVIYCSWIYCDTWHTGKKEGKVYSDIKASPLRGFVMGLFPVALGGLLCLLFLHSEFVGNFVLRIYLLPFLGFFGEGIISASEILLSLAVFPIFSTFGYFGGMKQFSVIEIYLSKRVKRQKDAHERNKKKEDEQRAQIIKNQRNQY